jgi:aldehyde dehydrogenase (NAD+)
MHKLADLVEQHAEILATIETLDNGKPYTVSLTADVPDVSNVLRYYAGLADKNFGQTIDVGREKFAYTIKEPLGVCGQIIPWVSHKLCC